MLLYVLEPHAVGDVKYPPQTHNPAAVGDSAVRHAASGSGIGGMATGKPSQGNAWLLSKSLPVDVRLLAAGAATLGGLYFFSSRSVLMETGHPVLADRMRIGRCWWHQ